jgi:CBS domain-containing protein
MSIQSILDRNRAEVITIRATETVKSAADRMREHSIAALVVKSDVMRLQEHLPFNTARHCRFRISFPRRNVAAGVA